MAEPKQASENKTRLGINGSGNGKLLRRDALKSMIAGLTASPLLAGKVLNARQSAPGATRAL